MRNPRLPNRLCFVPDPFEQGPQAWQNRVELGRRLIASQGHRVLATWRFDRDVVLVLVS
jgi:hypothetical protein